MSFQNAPRVLRQVLLADAATCLAAGALMTLANGPIAGITAIPQGLLLYAGLILFPIAAFMLFTATRATMHPAAIALIVAGNAAWVAASVWLMLGGVVTPNGWGQAFIGAQAAVVALLTLLEWRFSRHQVAGAQFDTTDDKTIKCL